MPPDTGLSGSGAAGKAGYNNPRGCSLNPGHAAGFTRGSADTPVTPAEIRNGSDQRFIGCSGCRQVQGDHRPILLASVPLPRDRFWGIQVARIDSPTRQPVRPPALPRRHPAQCASHSACHGPAAPGSGYRTSLRAAAKTPGARRELSAPGFALPWQTAKAPAPCRSVVIRGCARARHPGQAVMRNTRRHPSCACLDNPTDTPVAAGVLPSLLGILLPPGPAAVGTRFSPVTETSDTSRLQHTRHQKTEE
jgi:hypothetical protein